MDFFYSIAGFFSSGGLFMFPILLVFAVGLGIAIERYVTLSMVTNKNQQVWDKVQPMLTNGHCRAPCGAARTSRSRWKRA
jgi:biopolymer transport protein ExbB